MATFRCDKLGRDKTLEGFKKEGVTPQYKMLTGKELYEALLLKLVEEADEVRDARSRQELIEELADVLEVIDALCKTQGISMEEIAPVKEAKLKERGGFEAGLYIETVHVDDDNPKVEHFRLSPDKYPEE
jgi:predicted house-cleaning noncanonical NTP pyrophosphatase (MazG superfamily)